MIESFINRGNIWLKNGFLEDAALDYSRALEIDSASLVALVNRGYARYLANKGLGASDDLTKAIAIDPTYAPAYYYRAAVMFRAYEPQWASVDLARYLEINPKDADALSMQKIVEDDVKSMSRRRASQHKIGAQKSSTKVKPNAQTAKRRGKKR